MAEPEKKRVRRTRVKSEKEKERNREYQKKRYLAKKAQYQAERAERYRNDPDYQQRMKNTAKRRYWLHERAEEPVDPKLLDIAIEDLRPNGTMPVVVDGVLHQVAVYTTAALEAVLGRNASTLRLWLKNGILPEPYHRKNPDGLKLAKGSNPRLFTEDELRIIYDCRSQLALPSHGRQHDIFTRCVEEKFAALKKGIRVTSLGE